MEITLVFIQTSQQESLVLDVSWQGREVKITFNWETYGIEIWKEGNAISLFISQFTDIAVNAEVDYQ